MKINNIITNESQLSEVSANPDYLRAAERSISQAQATQRTFGKSPEERAAARKTELKREKGIAGYTKRHKAAHPEMYPQVKAQPAPKLRDPSTEYSDDYSTWARGRRDTMEQGVAEGQTPEQEIERLKLRQNAEHGGASLKRQAATQARIRELEKQLKDKKGVAETFIPYALSAANANAEFERQRKNRISAMPAGGGYRGRVEIGVESREDYIATGKTLAKAAKAAGQHIDYGLSDGVMKVFSDSMTTDELDNFIDDTLENFDQGVAEAQPEKIANRYDPEDFDDMVLRLKQKAKEQERKHGPVDLTKLAQRLRDIGDGK